MLALKAQQYIQVGDDVAFLNRKLPWYVVFLNGIHGQVSVTIVSFPCRKYIMQFVLERDGHRQFYSAQITLHVNEYPPRCIQEAGQQLCCADTRRYTIVDVELNLLPNRNYLEDHHLLLKFKFFEYLYAYFDKTVATRNGDIANRLNNWPHDTFIF